MDRLEQFRNELTAAVKEARGAIDTGDKDKIELANRKMSEKRELVDREMELRENEERARLIPGPSETKEADPKTAGAVLRRAMLQAATEKRAVTANGAGVNTVPGIVKALVDGGKLGGKVAKFYGPNSKTVVPVFAPHMAVPVGTAEGATGTGSDATAVLAGKELTLKPWYSTLPVSMGALMSTDIESELPAIFAEAFGAAIDKAIIVGAGSGNDALGVFVASSVGVTTSQDIAVAASGTPKWVDITKLALALIGDMNGPLDRAAIIINGALIGPMLSETNDPANIEYRSSRTVLGVPIILSSHAPTTLTAGSYVAVGGYFGHYALAVAQELTIDPIKTVGSDNVTFQAFMYMQGTPLVATSFRRLKTV